MHNKKRNSLCDKDGLLVGFGFSKHPAKKGWYVEIVFYKTDDEWIVCFSEGQGTGNSAIQRKGLGKLVAGKLFAPFAQRGIPVETANFRNFKALMTETMPDFVFEWVVE